MKKSLLLVLIVFSISANAQVNKIDHCFVSSPQAETLFKLFKNQFGLPTDWDFKKWGDFSSGAVTLGNVAFEFVYYEGVTKTSFDGIALEPKQNAEEIEDILDDSRVMHDTIEANTYVKSDGTVGGWSNMSLKKLLPDEVALFICDYKERDKVSSYRKQSSDSLRDINGGPLGILFLKEIVIGSTNISLNSNELAKLPGININRDNVYGFKEGPSIRLADSKTNGCEKIVIKVRSVKEAKKYLESQNLLGSSSKDSVFVDPKAIGGLMIELIDK